MAHKALVLILLLAVGLAASEQQDLAADDECSGGQDDEACAFNALQRRSSVVQKHGEDADLSSEAPDFELRDDAEGLSADELSEDFDEEAEDSDGTRETAEVDDVAAEASDSMPESAPATAGLVQSPFDTVPSVENCHMKNMTCPRGLKCVVKYDKTYSQCMSCASSIYDKECQKLDNYMRYAAMHSCKRTCADTKCYNKNWCIKPYHCVVDLKAQWGQCVSCKSKKQWTASCHGWTKSFYKKAKHTCHKRCRYGKGKSR